MTRMMPKISFHSTLYDGFPDLAQKERSRSRSRSPHIIEKNIDYKLEVKLRKSKSKLLDDTVRQKFIMAVTKRGILLREDRNLRRIVIEPQASKKFNCSQVVRLPIDFSIAMDFLE